jgi:hypothetical protein
VRLDGGRGEDQRWRRTFKGPNMKSLKIAATAAAAAALAFAPAAYAQATCSAINSLHEQALEDFDSIVGDEIEEEYYYALVNLDGATECTIEYSFDSIYTCMWVFDTQAEAAVALSSQISTMGSCLSGWSRETATPEANSTNGFRLLDGVYFSGSGNHIDLEWAAVTEEHIADEGTDWHVLVALAYLW